MKKLRVKFEGKTPILFSRMTKDEIEAITTGIRKPIAPDRDPREVAAERLYQKDGRPGIPYHMFYTCLVEAGRKVKFGPRTNITTSRGTNLSSFLTLREDFYPFEDNSSWEVDIQMGVISNRGQRVAIPIIRPRFDKWSFTVTAEIDDKRVALETVRALFEEAGQIGLGAWRPSSPKPGPFGQFKIIEWEVI